MLFCVPIGQLLETAMYTIKYLNEANMFEFLTVHTLEMARKWFDVLTDNGYSVFTRRP